MKEKLEQLKNLLAEISDLDHIGALLNWDMQTYMPPGGAEERAEQTSTISRLRHIKFTRDEIGELLEALVAELEGMDPDADDTCLIRKVHRDYHKARKVPAEWIAEFSKETSLAHQVWERARQEANFKRFAPHLRRIVELRRQYAEFFAPYDHIYDPLLDEFEPGMKTAQVKAVFDALRPRQVELIQAVTASPHPVENKILYQPFDEAKQWAFGEEVIKKFGYDFRRGRQDKAVHPFTTSFGLGDVRITTRVDRNFLNTALFGTLHEAGHAIYAQGFSPSLRRTPLAEGASLAVHESQSRLWENLVGRSRAFWVAFFPRLQELFPTQLGEVDLETFYRAINKVERSLIRVEADEATYNLHIMLRFEIELGMMEGRVEVQDLPELWNQKVQNYLGLTPSDDREGVLQDVHWSSGYIGYFSTYALGNLIASMLWEKIEKDIPQIERQIERAEFGDLLAWLRENIHRHGAKFEPLELVRRATGSDLTPEPYMRYLERKFGEIYRL
jgi:carboxypeptidase Taq